MSQPPPAEAAAEACCRICLEEDEPSNLIQPCGCRGTLAFAHDRCLQEWRSQKLRAEVCEICGLRYRPWGGLATVAIFFAQAALLAASSVLAHAALLVGGLPAPARCCFDFSRPWRRGLQRLFEAGDLDGNGWMSVAEMHTLADRTGEQNVTEEMLEKLVRLLGDGPSGLTEASFARTYWFGNNDTALQADLATYGLLSSLEYKAGDVQPLWLLCVGSILGASVRELWPFLPRWQSRSWFLAVPLCVLLRPWRCRLLICLMVLVGLLVCLVAWVLDDLEDEEGGSGGQKRAAAAGGAGGSEGPLRGLARGLTCTGLTGLVLLAEALLAP